MQSSNSSSRIGDAEPAAPPEQVSRRLSLTGLMLVLFVIILAVGLALSGWEEAWRSVTELGAWPIMALCAMALAHYLIRALRWHILVRVGQAHLRPGLPRTSFLDDMTHFFGGFAMTATPGRVGELVRLRWLQRATGGGLRGLVPILFADRAIELAAMVALIALALTATSLGSQAVWILLAVGAGLVFVLCRPRLMEGVLGTMWRLIGRRKSRLVVRLRRVIRRLDPFMKPPVLIPTLLIGLLGWSIEGAAFWLLLGWLGVEDMALFTAAAIFMVAILSGALSGLPGGLGGTEATAVALLLLQGVPAETAILATAIIRVTTLWFAVLIGLCIFPLAEMRAARKA